MGQVGKTCGRLSKSACRWHLKTSPHESLPRLRLAAMRGRLAKPAGRLPKSAQCRQRVNRLSMAHPVAACRHVGQDGILRRIGNRPNAGEHLKRLAHGATSLRRAAMWGRLAKPAGRLPKSAQCRQRVNRLSMAHPVCGLPLCGAGWQPAADWQSANCPLALENLSARVAAQFAACRYVGQVGQTCGPIAKIGPMPAAGKSPEYGPPRLRLAAMWGRLAKPAGRLSKSAFCRAL